MESIVDVDRSIEFVVACAITIKVVQNDRSFSSALYSASLVTLKGRGDRSFKLVTTELRIVTDIFYYF